MPWINEIDSPKKEILLAAYWSKSEKGLILKTAEYSCFLWKDSKLLFFLVNALNVYSHESRNQSIVIRPNKSLKEGFSLELGDNKSNISDYYWYATTNGWNYGKKQEMLDPFGLL